MAKRILIVEDDHLNRMLLSTILQGDGFHVMEVADGAHAVAAARTFVPNLITMDINLPNVSGVELIRTMRSDMQLRSIPVLAVTAYVGRGEEAVIREAGANELMAKPISVKPFVTAVNKLIAGETTRA